MKFLIFIMFVFFAASSYAQQKKAFSQEKYDSLKQVKMRLLSEKEALKAAIEKDREILDSLKLKVDEASLGIYTKKYGRDIGFRVSNKQIWKGMTEEMMRDSWGKPDKITKNVERWGVFTQWYYGSITYFFRDGKLTDWEDSSK